MGSSSICVLAGDTLKGDLRLNVLNDGVFYITYSMLFDRSGGGDSPPFDNELDLINSQEINVVTNGTTLVRPSRATCHRTTVAIGPPSATSDRDIRPAHQPGPTNTTNRRASSQHPHDCGT